MLTCPKCGQENPEGFKFCGNCGASLEGEAAAAREERKVVTVLFADLVGFTSRAEQLDPEDVRALLGPYYTRLRKELERHGGTVEKFIGDAVMAVFGAPVAHEDDPELAVRAALAIRDWIREQQEELQVRIAVNTGEALVSLGARPAEGEAMASGDVVNTTARLQTAAPVNGILVGAETYRATRHAIEYDDAADVLAKGKAEPIPVWEAVQARGRFGVDLLREVRTPLIGRERDLGALEDALDRARQRRSPQLVTLVGEPGIGKSRLAYELMQTVEAEPELTRWRQGRSLPYGEGVTFWALAEMVKAEAAILETDSPEHVGDKLHAAVEAVVSDQREAEWIEGHLRTLVGVGGEADLGVERQREAFAAWRRFLEALANERPLVLVFEDLHSADDSLLDFVDHLVEWASAVPILVLATARPELLERRTGWGGGKPNATTLTVAPLSDDETHRLIAALLERPLISADTQSELLSRAGGNPLYAEQYARMLAEHGSADRLTLPETVQGIIAARLDLLSAEEKALIQDASIVGKLFWSGAVAEIGGGEPWRTEELLHSLGRKEFVQRAQASSVAGETEYAFRHILVRDVAYGQIPRAGRARKHRDAAAWIETLGRPDDHAETLAHHYGEALALARATGEATDELVAQARSALRRAGDRAFALSSIDGARAFYRRALELTPPGELEWAELVVRHVAPGFNAEPESGALERARDILLAAERLEDAAEAELYLGWARWNEGRGREATDHHVAAVRLVSELPDSHTTAYLRANLAITFMLNGELDRALVTAGEALEIGEQLGLDDIRVHALTTLGSTRGFARDRGGLELIEQSLALALELNNAEAIVRGYKNLSSHLFDFGELDRSAALLLEAETAAARFGDAFNLRWFAVEGVLLLYHHGRWDEALRIADDFLAEVESGTPHYMEAAAREMRSPMLLARGDVAGALSESTRALEFGRGSGQAQVLMPALAVHVCALAAAGKIDEAGAVADELLAAASPAHGPTSWASEIAPVLHALGRGEALVEKLRPLEDHTPWEAGALAVASGDFERAAETYAAVGSRPHEAAARMLTGRREHVERALAFYESVGATRFVREAEDLLGPSAEARRSSG